MNEYYYNIKNFIRNLPLFLKLAWNWRSWDYTYTIEVLIKLLTEQANIIKNYGNSVNSDKIARRAYTAAGLLNKAYVDSGRYSYISSEYKRISDSYYAIKFPKLFKGKLADENRFKMHAKMLEIRNKRWDKIEAKRKKEAFEYLHKYIEQFWD